MANENDLSEFLQVGSAALFQPGLQPGGAPSIRTSILGWKTKSYLFLDRPRLRDRFLPLAEGMTCVVRFVREGAACGFASAVIDWSNFESDSWCRIAWPEEVHSVGFRRHQRVETNIPCTFSGEDGRTGNGEIRDISVGGCRIAGDMVFDKDTRLKLSFILPGCGPLQDVEAIVRRVDTSGASTCLGCEFAEGQAHIGSEIAFFITCKRTASDGMVSDRPRVLVIDQSHANRGLLWRAFDARGCEVITANSTVDGIFRLQLLHPIGLLVSRTLPDMQGLDVCRLIRANKSFESLPIVLYGAEDDTSGTPGLHAERIHYFPSLQASGAICDAIMQATATPE